VPVVGLSDWLSNELLARWGLAEVWLERGATAQRVESGVPTAASFNGIEEDAVSVMIGVDPHKGSHTAVAIGRDEAQLASHVLAVALVDAATMLEVALKHPPR
jgi:hypothetical protein